jgi:hypothetical protein
MTPSARTATRTSSCTADSPVEASDARRSGEPAGARGVFVFAAEKKNDAGRIFFLTAQLISLFFSQ